MNTDSKTCPDCGNRNVLQQTDLCAECIRRKFHEMIPYFERIRPRDYDVEAVSSDPKSEWTV
ncbi:hypothetical protein EHQ12_05755 [Leptospira gomenensis]|uniref:Uncharacterized protein n=1 Tax=Leptospira gomenensis TaxID=2484974 RepID=A0A5F1YDB9_9LEPT|nr:hypothetical protein [Leptospira gomenensis]TGK36047.1 hypothetical protein EHQ17_05585 [Leptospira gomenensis]TGK41792.1 hypothetical protein EHQ12_05755 [Leptospira gomenensis]TGK53350.1 hypothetical protein EHQ07_00145 [Leptospira gomenensis]TGK64956.1 hypothetical protein EHQ13_06390 [Leptospira gomenensis]